MSKKEFANDSIYEEVSNKLNIPLSKVKEYIKEGFFKSIKEEMESGCFNDICIPYLGKLKFNEKKFKAINYYSKLNKQK